MSLTSQEIEARKRWLGASESPGVIGVDKPPYPNAADIFIAKRHALEPIKGNDAIEIGNDFEAPLLGWAARELGVEIEVSPKSRLRPDDAVLGAKPDALILRQPAGLEAKTSSHHEEWGEEGTDVVPERVLIQTHQQMYVFDWDLVWVPVLTARFDRLVRLMYCVKRNDDLIKIIVERGHAFWNDHVLSGVPPPGLIPSFEVVKRIKRVPGSIALADPAIVAELIQARKDGADAEKRERIAKAKLMANSAEAFDYGDPTHWLTYFESPRAGYTVAPTTSRTLRVAKR